MDCSRNLSDTSQVKNSLLLLPNDPYRLLDLLVKIIKSILGNTVTVMSPEGKPIQVNTSALQAAAAQNAMGRLYVFKLNIN